MGLDTFVRDYSLLFGGYLQGLFAKAGGGEGGIDLEIECDINGINGSYKGFDFSVYFSRNDLHLAFNFLLNIPKRRKLGGQNLETSSGKMKYIREIKYDELTNPEDKSKFLNISCLIIDDKARIEKINHVFYEIWQNLLKQNFIWMMESKR
jgi:hypothetical protein